MTYDMGDPEFQGPPEVAEIETEEDIDDPKWADRHWLLIVGIGVVVLGLLIRWLVKRR